VRDPARVCFPAGKVLCPVPELTNGFFDLLPEARVLWMSQKFSSRNLTRNWARVERRTSASGSGTGDGLRICIFLRRSGPEKNVSSRRRYFTSI